MKIRTKLIGTVVLGAALLTPVAQAQRPDDQAGPRGPGAIVSNLGSAASHPDSRGDGARGPEAGAAQETFVQGVNDFPGSSQLAPQAEGAPVRGDVKDGVGTSPGIVVIVGDDKRGIAKPVSGVLVGDDKQNVPLGRDYDPAAGYYNQYAYRRALPQDIDSAPIQVVSAPNGFDWGDAAIGGLGGAGAALLVTGFAFLLTSQRNKARTA